jgi:hypothetical protein
LIGRASIAGRAGSVDDAVDRGIGVIGTADVDLGFCEPFTGEEQRQRGKEVAFVVGHVDLKCADLMICGARHEERGFFVRGWCNCGQLIVKVEQANHKECFCVATRVSTRNKR